LAFWLVRAFHKAVVFEKGVLSGHKGFVFTRKRVSPRLFINDKESCEIKDED
jgi:hypothetical protein